MIELANPFNRFDYILICIYIHTLIRIRNNTIYEYDGVVAGARQCATHDKYYEYYDREMTWQIISDRAHLTSQHTNPVMNLL